MNETVTSYKSSGVTLLPSTINLITFRASGYGAMMNARLTVFRLLPILLLTGVPIASFTFRGCCRYRPAVTFQESHGFGCKKKSTEDDSENGNAENSNSSINSDIESSFYRDLQKAKTSKLGANIPQEQLQALTAKAESEFLQAMEETQSEFQQIKREMGSDAAVDMLLNRIQQQEEKDRCNTTSSSSSEDDHLLSEFE
jgi:hypothetical protein